MKHSVNPWTIESGDFASVIKDANGAIIASAHSSFQPDMSGKIPLPHKMNGNLIKAAPELLEACEVALAELENYKSVPGVSQHIIPCLEAAIKRATA